MKRQIFIISLIVPMVAIFWTASADASGFGRFAGPSSGGLIRTHVARVAIPAQNAPTTAEKVQLSTSQPVPTPEISAKKISVEAAKGGVAKAKPAASAQKPSLPPLQRWLAEQLGAFPAIIPALL